MKISPFPIIIFFFAGCNTADTSKHTEHHKIDSIISAPTISIQLSPQADSIEQTNAATIKFDGDDVQKVTISKIDSSVQLTANMKVDHRIFGYEKPDTTSKKMILLSIFTNDVKDNPFKLPFGAYYSTSDMENTQLKYVGNEDAFVKVNVFKDKGLEGVVFIEKVLVEFED